MTSPFFEPGSCESASQSVFLYLSRMRRSPGQNRVRCQGCGVCNPAKPAVLAKMDQACVLAGVARGCEGLGVS